MSKQKVSSDFPVLPAMLIVGGIVFFNKIMEALGLSKDPDEKAVDDRDQAAIEQAVKNEEAKQPSSKTDAEWSAIADTIYGDLHYSSLDDDKDDAAYQLARAKNETDVYKLIQFFGNRTEYAFGLPTGKGSLMWFVSGNLSNDQINAVNDNYSRKGIKFRW